MKETVASLVEEVSVVSVHEVGSTIHKYFETNSTSSGVVVMNDNRKPVGLIMRTDFYQIVGTKFGYSIYMNRPIDLLMKKEILCLDIGLDLAQFGFKAMSRTEKNIYDFVLIMNRGEYHGIVSISKFLAAMSDIKQREIELLNEQRKILTEAHEKEKDLRQEIQTKNESIKKLLDNADQGFLSFHEDQIIYEEHSSVCNVLFQTPIARLHFGELMKDYLDPKQHRLLIETLSRVFSEENKSKAKVYLTLLPVEFKAGDRYISINYKLISFRPKKILMVILTDITDKKVLEKKNQEEKNNMKLVLSALNSKTEMLDAIEEATTFFSEELHEIFAHGKSFKEIIGELFRIIHTMKGDFALRMMHNTAFNLHVIEDKLAGMLKNGEAQTMEELRSLMLSIQSDDILKEDLDIIKGFLGNKFFESDKSITISSERLETMLSLIDARFSGEDKSFLITTIQELTYPSLNSILSGYNEYIQILALKLDKIISDFEISGDTVFVNRQLYSGFLKSIIHIFRNLVDHGIESTEERVEKGKEEKGKIQCGIYRNEKSFVLEISDDGKGIDPEKILNIAVSKGIYCPEQVTNLSKREIVNTIFLDSFSTKIEVSMLSGRGVGLSAVRTEVESLGGQVEVITALNKGTTFSITLPLLN